MIFIGIDVGVNTGFAKSFNGKLCEVKTYSTVQAQADLLFYCKNGKTPDGVKVFIEDARKRKWFTGGREKAQGAGAIKIQCKLWEDFLQHYGFDYELIAPKNNTTKLSAEQFAKLTGWEYRTNEHSRDAAMLIFGRG